MIIKDKRHKLDRLIHTRIHTQLLPAAPRSIRIEPEDKSLVVTGKWQGTQYGPVIIVINRSFFKLQRNM